MVGVVAAILVRHRWFCNTVCGDGSVYAILLYRELLCWFVGRYILFIASEIEFGDLTSTVLSNKSMYIIIYKND